MTVLRVIAILVALGGVLDPSLILSRAVPTPVRLHVDRSDPDVADVEARLRAAMDDRLEFVAEGDADAHVVVRTTRLDAAALSKPVSLVTLQDEPDTAIVAAPSAVQVPVSTSRASRSPFERAASRGERAPSCSKTARWSWGAPNTAGAEPQRRRSTCHISR